MRCENIAKPGLAGCKMKYRRLLMALLLCVCAVHTTARRLTHATVLTRRQTGKSRHGTVVQMTPGNLIMLC